MNECTTCGAPNDPGTKCHYCGLTDHHNKWLTATAHIIAQEIELGIAPGGPVNALNHKTRERKIKDLEREQDLDMELYAEFLAEKEAAKAEAETKKDHGLSHEELKAMFVWPETPHFKTIVEETAIELPSTGSIGSWLLLIMVMSLLALMLL